MSNRIKWFGKGRLKGKAILSKPKAFSLMEFVGKWFPRGMMTNLTYKERPDGSGLCDVEIQLTPLKSPCSYTCNGESTQVYQKASFADLDAAIVEKDPACTCKPTCLQSCNGDCGCQACHRAYQDFLSEE